MPIAPGLVRVVATVLTVDTARTALSYGTSDGKVFRLENANTATPASTPVDVWTGKGLPSGGYLSCIAVNPVDGDNAMVVFSNYNVVSLFITTNGGSTWSSVAGNLEQFGNGSGNGPS